MVYTADSIRKFDSKSNRTADSIRDSIRTQKNDSQVPILVVHMLSPLPRFHSVFNFSVSFTDSVNKGDIDPEMRNRSIIVLELFLLTDGSRCMSILPNYYLITGSMQAALLESRF